MKRLVPVLFLLLLAACSSAPVEVTRVVTEQVEVTRVVEVTREVEVEVVITQVVAPTSLPASSFGSPECDEYTEAVIDLVQRWNDTYEIANSTARINLSDRVAELNDLRQEARGLDEPDCASALGVKHLMVEMMGAAIDMFTEFMADNDISFEDAIHAMYIDLFIDSYEALLAGEPELPRWIHYLAVGETDYFLEYTDETGETVSHPRPGATNRVRDNPVIISVQMPEGTTAAMKVSNLNGGSNTLFCFIYVNGVIVDSEERNLEASCEYP